MIIDGKVYCDYCYDRYGLKHESICDNFSFIELSQYPFFKFSGAVCYWCFIYFRHHFYDGDWSYRYHSMLEKESEKLEEKVYPFEEKKTINYCPVCGQALYECEEISNG